MVFTFFKTKRSAPTKKQDDQTAATVRPHTSLGMSSSSVTDRCLFPNPLTLNPPNRLHWTPKPHGTAETTGILSGDASAALALNRTMSRAERLSRTIPDLNLGGLAATQRWLTTNGPAAVDELRAEQARAEERLRNTAMNFKKTHRRTNATFTLMSNESLTVLPATSFQASVKAAAPELYSASNNASQPMLNSRKSSFDIAFENSLAELLSPMETETVSVAGDEAGCDACKACFEKCSTCYAAQHETGCDMCRSGLCKTTTTATAVPRNPSPERLARLDKRPAPLTGAVRPVSIAASLLTPVASATAASGLWQNQETLASLGARSTEEKDNEDEDVVEICDVREIGVVVTAKVVDVAPVFPHVKPLTITIPASRRLAVPSATAPFENYSLPLKRPDSPTLPSAFPAPLFSTRK